jgi:glycosyltransferase involved in cell wall biosynthesis
MLEQITPLILTYNEAPNIDRNLEQLRWAGDIVVVDSFSDDETLSLVAKFPQARVFQRRFDCLENQWNYAIEQTGISTEWVLALDADYITTPALVEELSRLRPAPDVNGYRASFRYCVYGERLRGSAYPPVVVLYRRARAHYRQDGHAHRVVVAGRVESLREPMLHDDRKSLTRWLQSQNTYMRQEVDKLLESGEQNLPLPDRIRGVKFLAPFLVFLHCMIAKRGILDGKKGLYYALQRMLAETLLSIYLLDKELVDQPAAGPEVTGELLGAKSHSAKT